MVGVCVACGGEVRVGDDSDDEKLLERAHHDAFDI